jgi:hypothetical protein
LKIPASRQAAGIFFRPPAATLCQHRSSIHNLCLNVYAVAGQVVSAVFGSGQLERSFPDNARRRIGAGAANRSGMDVALTGNRP